MLFTDVRTETTVCLSRRPTEINTKLSFEGIGFPIPSVIENNQSFTNYILRGVPCSEVI